MVTLCLHQSVLILILVKGTTPEEFAELCATALYALLQALSLVHPDTKNIQNRWNVTC